MSPNTARCAAAAIAGLTALPAAAGDYADRAIFGFSPDGGYFAFEEYGVQDGSGFPYSNIYVIAAADDDWVGGTPVRVRLDDEMAELSQARAQALQQATPILQQYAIGTPGYLVVTNPTTETSADPHYVSFRPHPTLPTAGGYQLTLEEYALPAPDCPDRGQPFTGFRLTLGRPNGSASVINQDARIPSSRRCPLSYGISDVLTFYPAPAAAPVIAVLINVFSVGFEGPDRRFVAVTTSQ